MRQPMPESFEYEGRAYRQPGNDEVTVDKQTFTVIEFLPYEPSNYVHAPTWIVEAADGTEYAIDAGDKMEHEGRCWTCGAPKDDQDRFCEDCVTPVQKSIMRHKRMERKRTPRAVARAERRQRARESRHMIAKIFRETYRGIDTSDRGF